MGWPRVTVRGTHAQPHHALFHSSTELDRPTPSPNQAPISRITVRGPSPRPCCVNCYTTVYYSVFSTMQVGCIQYPPVSGGSILTDSLIQTDAHAKSGSCTCTRTFPTSNQLFAKLQTAWMARARRWRLGRRLGSLRSRACNADGYVSSPEEDKEASSHELA